MATIQELSLKIANNTATADDLVEFAKLANEKAKDIKKVETQLTEIISNLKALNADKQILTNLLANEGLIILPKVEEKVYIYERDVKTDKGTASKFKLWIGRKPWKETNPAVGKYWAKVVNDGKAKFLASLNEEGKKWIITEDGKAWLKDSKLTDEKSADE